MAGPSEEVRGHPAGVPDGQDVHRILAHLVVNAVAVARDEEVSGVTALPARSGMSAVHEASHRGEARLDDAVGG